MNEKFWRIMESIGKKLIFISVYFSCFVGFLFLFFAYSTPLPLLKLITTTDVVVCVLSLMFLLVFGLWLVDKGKGESSFHNNMDRINERMHKALTLTGDTVAWYLIK